mgnify:CR=1 FL=1|jgi:hypothetical protein
MKAKLTKRMIEAIESGQKDVLVWDSEIRGFGCKVTPAGARILLLQYTRHA